MRQSKQLYNILLNEINLTLKNSLRMIDPLNMVLDRFSYFNKNYQIFNLFRIIANMMSRSESTVHCIFLLLTRYGLS